MNVRKFAAALATSAMAASPAFAGCTGSGDLVGQYRWEIGGSTWAAAGLMVLDGAGTAVFPEADDVTTDINHEGAVLISGTYKYRADIATDFPGACTWVFTLKINNKTYSWNMNGSDDLVGVVYIPGTNNIFRATKVK